MSKERFHTKCDWKYRNVQVRISFTRVKINENYRLKFFHSKVGFGFLRNGLISTLKIHCIHIIALLEVSDSIRKGY